MWQVIGASSIGTSHMKTQTRCQDAHGFRLLENDCVIAAAADGLGSAPRAHEGSALAVTSSLDFAAAALQSSAPTSVEGWQAVLLDAFLDARKKLEELAQINGAKSRDFATTLMLTVLTDSWLAVAHIGDGGVVAKINGKFETVSPPLRGEFANITTPLTATQWMESSFCTVYQKRAQAVALLTDGLQNQALNSSDSSPHKPFFQPFFEMVSRPIDPVNVSSQLHKFLDSERVCATTDDDKTLVVIGWLDPAFALDNLPSEAGT